MQHRSGSQQTRSDRRRILRLPPRERPLISQPQQPPFPPTGCFRRAVMEDSNVGQQQDSAGQGDIAAESSSTAAVGSGESGLVAEEAQHNFHLPAHLDVSDGSGVSRPHRCGVPLVIEVQD